jgi:hypothetical protein
MALLNRLFINNGWLLINIQPAHEVKPINNQRKEKQNDSFVPEENNLR